MLEALAGKTHTVMTGYCIFLHGSKHMVNAVSSKVKIRPLSPAAIQKYIESGEPMDKAGAYAAQGLGTSLIQQITGSYTNVVGLPISDVLMDMDHHFGFSLFNWLTRSRRGTRK